MHEPIKDLLTARDLLANSDNSLTQKNAARLHQYFRGADALEHSLNPNCNRVKFLEAMKNSYIHYTNAWINKQSITMQKKTPTMPNYDMIGGVVRP